MAYARLLRIARGFDQRRRCRDCRKPIRLVLDVSTGRKRYLPFAIEAKPIDRVQDERHVKYDLYDETAYHKCPKHKPRATPKPDARQESFL